MKALQRGPGTGRGAGYSLTPENASQSGKSRERPGSAEAEESIEVSAREIRAMRPGQRVDP